MFFNFAILTDCSQGCSLFLFSVRDLFCVKQPQVPSLKPLNTDLPKRTTQPQQRRLSLADGVVKDTLPFVSSCLDVGRGHHPLQGTGGTV